MYYTVLLDAAGVILNEPGFKKNTKEINIKTFPAETKRYSFIKYTADFEKPDRAFSPRSGSGVNPPVYTVQTPRTSGKRPDVVLETVVGLAEAIERTIK